MPDGYAYTAQVVVLAQDSESAQEQARQWFRREQPYHKTDTDYLTTTLDQFHVTELGSFLCYGVGDKPTRWSIPRSHVLKFK
jgi:hypothetical protein